MSTEAIPVRFSLADAERASDQWGANCGPAAIAAVAGLTLDELRPHMGDFESKRYTNPTLMFQVLRRLDLLWSCPASRQSSEHQGMLSWPEYGLARIQWEGPWTKPGVPMRARYRHTHWGGSRLLEGQEQQVFDINCMCVGGWVPLSEWSGQVVPWLLRECEPKATGRWHLTHAVDVQFPATAGQDESARTHEAPNVVRENLHLNFEGGIR